MQQTPKGNPMRQSVSLFANGKSGLANPYSSPDEYSS